MPRKPRNDWSEAKLALGTASRFRLRAEFHQHRTGTDITVGPWPPESGAPSNVSPDPVGATVQRGRDEYLQGVALMWRLAFCLTNK
jgi:hypothetical protein